MIVKSMSRKVPSFGQLIGYIDRDEGQEPYRIRHNVFARDPDLIRAEFEQNGELLQKRKNGVYLYHEIISITRAKGLDAEEQKTRLRDIAESYIAARCPDNLVFGGLHEDKEHSYHYHLMISANRAGETGRLRLTKAQFREVQVGLERHVLETYPELEQKIAIDKRSDRGRKKGEAELERRTGKRPKREEVLERVLTAYEASEDRQSLLDALGREGLELYVRGKNLGVVDLESGKKHRLKTLDLETADRVAIRMEGGELVEEQQQDIPEPEQAEVKVESEEKSASEGEKEKAPDRDAGAQRKKRERKANKEPKRQKSRKGTERKQRTDRPEPETDNEHYVKNGSNADLKSEPASMQNPEARQGRVDFEKEKSVSDKPAPNKERQELIDKGHIAPDPNRDGLSLEQWEEQKSFLGKVKQSVRRTFDDFRGRTKDLEEKAEGKEHSPPEKTKTREPRQQSGRSSQQEKWRSEIRRSRDSGRDDPEQGRE
jgi:hypothetical protein